MSENIPESQMSFLSVWRKQVLSQELTTLAGKKGKDSNSSETRRTSFQTDRDLETVFDPISKQILGDFLISKDVYKDLHSGQDFGIYRISSKTAAVRWRRLKWMEKFREEFTIRYQRPSGIETEIHKVRNGLVDLFLYGFGDEFGRPYQYHILDFKVFREFEPEPAFIWKNTDEKGSKGAAYRLNQFPLNLVLKKWERKEAGVQRGRWPVFGI